MTKEELARLQKKLGLSALKLAKELGVEYSTLYRYLNGKLKIPRPVELAMETIEKNFAETQKLDPLETIILIIKSSEPLKTQLNKFGERVKKLREAKGITQEDFADEPNKFGASYLSEIENGKKSNISLLSIQKISKRLKIKIEVIFDCEE